MAFDGFGALRTFTCARRFSKRQRLGAVACFLGLTQCRWTLRNWQKMLGAWKFGTHIMGFLMPASKDGSCVL